MSEQPVSQTYNYHFITMKETISYNLFLQVTQRTVITYPPRRKLKSILKSNTTTASSTPMISKVERPGSVFSQSLDSTSNSSKQHYLTGVKLIKTCEGKLMLVSDDRSISGKPFKIESAGGKQLVIKNNQVLSVKSISPIKNDGVQNITVSEMMPTKIPSSPPKTIILKKSALLKSPTVFPTNNKIVTSLFHNKINENSLLKTPLAMPDIIPIKHNTNIYKSNDNEIVEISPSNEETEKQTLVKDNSKTTTSIFKDIEMKNVINTDINPFLEKFNNPEFTEIPTSVCNTTDIFIETPSGNTVKENLTSNKESIFLESNTDNESNGEKSKINKGGPVSRELLPQIITESDKNEPTKFNKPPIKPPDIQFNEDSNNKCEILCNSNAESPLKNDEVASESSTPLKIINTVEENSDSETATFSTLESNIMKESNVTNTEKKSDVGDNVENIMNEKSNNLTENNDLTSNTEKPFLVNVVSEIFLSKTDNEMSTQTSAAALTQMKDAANDNFNLSLLSKEAEKKHFTIVESNEQNSFASKILKSVPSINETDICTDIETQRPLINTTKESDVSSNKNNKTLNSLSPKPADEIKVLNSVNEETISKTTLLPNKESNFFDTNSEITSETSVEKAFHERGICLEHSKEQINSSSTNQKSSKLLNNRQCNKELPEITVKIDNKDDSNLSYVNKQSSVKNHTDVNKTIKQNSVVERTEVNMEEKNSNSVESEYENSKINNNSNSHKTDKNTLVQIKCDITKACSKEDILPTVVSNDFPYIDNINSVSQTIIDKNDSKTQTSNEKDDFKDTNNVKIATQIEKQVCTENIEADNHSKSQIISNLVDHEALMKICSDAIKNECTKANIETVKKINVSVSVTISTQINQNSPEENSKEVTSIVKHNNSSKCNSHQIKYNVLPTNTKKLLCKHALRNKHKSRSLKNVKKNLIKNSLLNKTTKKFHKTPRQISPTSTEFLKRHNLFRRMKNKQRKTDSARQIVCKRQSNKTCKDEKMPLHKKNADLWNKSISETQEAKIPIIKSDGNIDTTPEILSEIDSKSESQISPLQAPPKIFNEIPRSTKYIVKSKYHKNMSTNHNECNVLQTNIKALNTSLPLSQDTDVGNDKQFAFCKFIIKSNEGSNEINSDVSSNENNNKELSLNTDTTVLTGATTKFPLSKRISNVVIHTLHTQNSTNDYNFAKENAEPSTNMENNMTNTVDLSSHETDTTSSKICTSKLLSTDQNKNVTQMLLTNRNDVKENKNKSRNILASKRASLKRTIKFVSAKVNNVFTIDNDSFSKDSKRTSQSIQKSKTTYQKQSPIFDSNVRIKLLQRLQGNEKKGLPYDRGRIRKEGISTSDIICASKILRSKNMKCKNNDIAIKICALAENTAKVNDVVSIIDKKSFLKNAKLAEKFINIENMKKKLHANICEDSDCKNPK